MIWLLFQIFYLLYICKFLDYLELPRILLLHILDFLRVRLNFLSPKALNIYTVSLFVLQHFFFFDAFFPLYHLIKRVHIFFIRFFLFHHVFHFFFDIFAPCFLATSSEIAIAWLLLLPLSISSFMFSPIAFFEPDCLSGNLHHLLGFQFSHAFF